MSLACICQVGTIDELRSKTPDIIEKFKDSEIISRGLFCDDIIRCGKSAKITSER